MNKWQKGVLGNRVEEDEKILKRLKKHYTEAKQEIDDKISALLARTDKENLQSIIYQVEYQKSLKTQINAILDNLNTKQFDDISKYLKESYESGFIGALYDIHGQGIPFIFPIDQEQIIRVLKNNSKLSKNLWGSLYDRNSALQNKMRAELSRGISQGFSYNQMAKSVANQLGLNYNNVARIVRTESHRIANEATMDALYKAKDSGAEIVKQWDATLDSRTRPEHQILDGQIQELEEAFEVNGNTTQYPGGFGIPGLDINCRCAVLQRAKWALDEEELESLKERAKYFGLDKNDNFEDYKKKYLEVIESPQFKNPYYGKKYMMQADGSLIEGENNYNDIYEIEYNTPFDITEKDGKLYPTSEEVLKKIKEGEKFNEYTWSMNENGTFSKGIIKNQAQYKLNLQNNKVLNVDLDKVLDEYGKSILDNEEKYYAFADTFLPKEVVKNFDYKINQGINIEQAFFDVVKENNYDGIYFVSSKDQIDNYIKTLDDKIIKKTKKSKLETLTTKLAKEQKKLNKIDNKSYSGIWYNQEVKVSDYKLKKDSIQAKKAWYIEQIDHLNTINPDDIKIKQYKKYLDDLDEFEKLGKEYEELQDNINKIQNDVNKLKPKVIVSSGRASDPDAYTQERKNAAYWFTNSNGSVRGADKVYRDKSGEVWRNATQDERDAIYEYTRSYKDVNESLRGIEYGTGKYIGVGKIDLNEVGVHQYGSYNRKPGQVKKKIDGITSIIDKSSYDHDIWLQRGCNYDGTDKFLGVNINDFYGSEKNLADKILGTTPTEYAFMSTGVAKGTGLNVSSYTGITFNIYAPKGTKMMYAEPFSAFGNGAGKNWNGIDKQTSFGSEAEMLVQRGTQFRITKVEKSGSRWYIDMEVIDQKGGN